MRRLTDFRVLTFDCYGTLIDWERGILAELRPWLDRHGRPDIADDALLAAFGETEAACEAETPARRYPEILVETLRRLSVRFGIAPDATAERAFGASVGRWPAFADSPAALDYLKRHYKLVVLSNVDRASFAESNARLGVGFDHVVTAEDVGSYKPDPRNFRRLLNEIDTRFGLGAAAVLHTAQSIFHDIVPAKTFGLATMWVNRRKAQGGWGATPTPKDKAAAQPDFEVASLAELVALHQAQLRGEVPAARIHKNEGGSA